MPRCTGVIGIPSGHPEVYQVHEMCLQFKAMSHEAITQAV